MIQPQENNQVSSLNKSARIVLALLTFALLLIIVGGVFWFFALSPNAPVGIGWFVFSFAAGLTMIVLPCTLPLVFVIVPLVMGKGYKKGLATALSFSLGVAITLSLYGVLAAILGKAVFAFSEAEGETVKNIFYVLAGIFALVFALSELGLMKIKLPSYTGAVPQFIQKRTDFLKPFLMGLFLGNIGVGCPHPATPIILGQIGIVGDVFYGWLLFFIHAIGRILPLFVLAVFGIIGINATQALVKHREGIQKSTAWGMIFVGAFLLTLGFFSHDWWVNSGQHSLLEEITREAYFTDILKERLNSEVTHRHGAEVGTGMFGAPLWLGNWVLVVLMVIPMWWYLFKEKKRINLLAIEEYTCEKKNLYLKKYFVLTLTLLLALVFIRVLPHWFLEHKALEDIHQEDSYKKC